MKKSFDRLLYLFTAGGTVLTYNAWVDGIRNSESARIRLEILKDIQGRLIRIEERIAKCEDAVEKARLLREKSEIDGMVIEMNKFFQGCMDKSWGVDESATELSYDYFKNKITPLLKDGSQSEINLKIV